MNSHAMDWTNLKIYVLIELAMEFQDPEHQTFSSATDVRPIRHQKPRCCAPIYQAKQSRTSRAKLFTASPRREQLRKCQEDNKPFSLSKKPATKTLIGTESKRSLKKGKVSIQKSNSETDKEI
jgi:hypothetical protein